jgi:hypothetical protein
MRSQLVLLISGPAWLFLNFSLGRKFAITPGEHAISQASQWCFTEKRECCLVRCATRFLIKQMTFSDSIYLEWCKIHQFSKSQSFDYAKFIVLLSAHKKSKKYKFHILYNVKNSSLCKTKITLP